VQSAEEEERNILLIEKICLKSNQSWLATGREKRERENLPEKAHEGYFRPLKLWREEETPLPEGSRVGSLREKRDS
jgi:hypothetical protein